MEEQFDWSPSPPSSPLSSSPPLSPLFDPSSSDSLSYSSSPPPPHILLDSQQLPVTISGSLSSSDANSVLDSINAYLHQVFVYGDSWHVITRAVALDPHCLLALVLMADYLIANESFGLAVQYLRRARHLLQLHGPSSPHSARERLYVVAWNEWVKGKRHALVTLTELIAAHPSDLFAVKKAQLIAFLQGDFPRMLSIVRQPAVEAACGGRPFYHGMLAFALEENGEVEEAEVAARKGVAMDATDVWSYHAIAHCLLHQGRVREGIEWMERHCGVWEHCMSFMYTHAWFHTALFYLDAQRFDRVQHCYEQHIWRQTDACSTVDHTQLSTTASTATPAAATPSLPPTPAPHRQLPIAADSPSIFTPFLHTDKSKTEDQLNALLILWKWELRVTPPPASTAGEGDGGKGEEGEGGFEGRWKELVGWVGWPPGNCLGLYGLLLLHALVRAGEVEKAKQLRALMADKVDAMDDADRGKKKAKHAAIFLPMADAIFTADTDPSPRGQQAAYDLISPIMTTYHRYLHRQERKHQRKGQPTLEEGRAAAPSPPSTPPSSASETASASASWSVVSFPWSGRHLLQVLVGSGEQRSVLTDWWVQLLYSSGHHQECEEEARRWLREKRGDEGKQGWQRWVDACQQRLLSPRAGSAQGAVL